MFKWFEKYFTFSRAERNAILALLTLSFVVLLAPHIYNYLKPVDHADNSKFKQEIDAFTAGGNNNAASVLKDSAQALTDTAQVTQTKKPRNSSYFNFDPNKIGVEEWQRLGFSEKQAQSIELYKQKGGRFYRPQDLMRLYVLDEEHYYKLKPFVRIDTAGLPKRNYNRY